MGEVGWSGQFTKNSIRSLTVKCIIFWPCNAVITRKKQYKLGQEEVEMWLADVTEGLKGRKFWAASSSVNKCGLNLRLWIF